ncbi:succinate dehydrogenase, cytochrome b556 subunit [Rubellimicrobium aerolatum]|uniref:Succinate dehydrogenase cytochrome b556 subunit n=1 Tax=Rubellimicrobium aerolatum TaxID=490979 RepID=A0ABW0S9M2_9RHOB|nr:succinate dehydrogenase, cytochrome b556 subunit [Rubellimicrobium aerolatum]MBP1804974.1 succinate dehydrogenase / fumarate reductase cytochrome b subunit [Rubellimicrobium aerolatum]
MPDIPRGNRPLSPHLQIYRPQWTTATSILTRITGVGLIVGTILVVWWLLAAATGPDHFATADAVLRSWFGDLVLLGSVWALWYHTLAGIRHLVWSTGRFMEIHQAELFGKIIVGLSVVLTILTVLILWVTA